MYAVELFFSDALENVVKQKWAELAHKDITKSIYQIRGIRPHVTLAVYESIEDLEAYKRDFEMYFESIASLDSLEFVDLGAFPTTGTVFMKPTVTKSLLDFHGEYHQAFEKYSNFASTYYLPDVWHPHCTYAIGLNHISMVEVFSCVLEDFKPMKSAITEIALVEIIHDGACFVSSETLLSKKWLSI